ncbi:MAG: hypothetical protein J5895_03595 [Alphaproteobacteria bacterium]|nr:hypothetical protein [Alphaproteobacteria bacterium]
MGKYTYRRAGALVNMQTDEQSLTAEIRKGDDALNLKLTRKQEAEQRIVEDEDGEYQLTDQRAYYDIDLRLGDEHKLFSANFIVSSDFEKYSADLNKGIPDGEYKSLCTCLEKQNKAVAQVFEDYILNKSDLEKENNLSQSIFNKMLGDFLSK